MRLPKTIIFLLVLSIRILPIGASLISETYGSIYKPINSPVITKYNIDFSTGQMHRYGSNARDDVKVRGKWQLQGLGVSLREGLLAGIAMQKDKTEIK
jgi:hypothetical protein